MKKMYFLTILLIFIITAGFFLFSKDENTINQNFLSSYKIIINPKPISFEEATIPKEFDSVYENYNLIQLESGLDLTPYKGRKAIRFTYKMLNFPDDENREIFADVLCINGKPVAGDIMCPELDGFMLPLSYLTLNK